MHQAISEGHDGQRRESSTALPDPPPATRLLSRRLSGRSDLFRGGAGSVRQCVASSERSESRCLNGKGRSRPEPLPATRLLHSAALGARRRSKRPIFERDCHPHPPVRCMERAEPPRSPYLHRTIWRSPHRYASPACVSTRARLHSTDPVRCRPARPTTSTSSATGAGRSSTLV